LRRWKVERLRVGGGRLEGWKVERLKVGGGGGRSGLVYGLDIGVGLGVRMTEFGMGMVGAREGGINWRLIDRVRGAVVRDRMIEVVGDGLIDDCRVVGEFVIGMAVRSECGSLASDGIEELGFGEWGFSAGWLGHPLVDERFELETDEGVALLV